MSPVLPKTTIRQTRGFTLVELIAATAILLILTGMAIPLAHVTIKRARERELRHAIWEMRDGIDRYKDAADRGAFQIKAGSEGYPPDLETLVNGVDVGGKKQRFLRRIPTDPPHLGFLGRKQCFRRLHEISGHGARRDEIQGLVERPKDQQLTHRDGERACLSPIACCSACMSPETWNSLWYSACASLILPSR